MRLIYSGIILLLFLVTLPMGAAIALIIFLSSGPPVLFVQKRVGKNGKPLLMYKFRTMQRDAETKKWEYMSLNESDGPAFKIRNDPRFTGIGKFLSHSGLDELPQLFNVLKGDMALIGPRPLPPSEVKKLASWMKKRHAILPGIISPAVLTGRYHENFTQWMKSDVRYAETKNMYQDAAILVRCVPFLLGLVRKEIVGHIRDKENRFT